MAARNGVGVVVWRVRGVVLERVIIAEGVSGDSIPLDTAPGAPPQIVAGGDGFLATWDNRARHFNANGLPDAPRFDLPLAADIARVAWDGGAYVVVARSGSAIRGIRAGAAGALGAAFVIAGGVQTFDTLGIASDGSRTLVVYGVGGMYAKFLDDPAPPSPFHGHRASQSNVHAAFDGVDVVVSFRQELPHFQSEIRLARFTPRGEALDGAGIVVASGAIDESTVAGGGGMSLVVWDVVTNGNAAYYAQRFTAALTPLDPAPLQLTAVCANGPRAVWDGSAFVVFWNDCRGTFAMRIGRDAAPVQVHPVPLVFGVARSADRFMLAYGNFSPAYAVGVGDDLHLATPTTLLTRDDELVYTPAIASDGSDFAAAWRDIDEMTIAARRVSPNADVLGGRIDLSANRNPKGSPRVRWDGAWWTVTWPEIVDASAVAFMAARIAPDGTPSAPVTVGLAPLIIFPQPIYDWDDAAGTLIYSRWEQPPGVLGPDMRVFLQKEEPKRARVVR